MNFAFPKVLYIGPASDYGGIAAVISSYTKYINDIKLISTISSKNNSNKLFSFLNVLYYINKLLNKDKEIQILHIHSASKNSFLRKVIIAFIGKLYGKRIIFHIHGGSFDQFYFNSGKLKNIIRLILQQMDMVICLSEEWRQFFVESIQLSNVEVLGNPVDCKGNNSTNIDDDILHLLFLGKICDDKGLFDLLTYFNTNKYFLNNQIRLSIGGNGETSRLQSILASPIYNTNVQFRGWVKHELKDSLLNECDAFILPSYFEGLPVSILEAMSFGKPVISTKVGGIPSIVKVGYNGWLFDIGSFDQLDDIFDQIFLNNSILSEYGVNSYNTAKKYAPDVIYPRLNQLYDSILTF